MSADDMMEFELARAASRMRQLRKNVEELQADRDAWQALAERMVANQRAKDGRIRFAQSTRKMGGSAMSLVQRAYRHQGIIVCRTGWQLRALQMGKRMQNTHKLRGVYPRR